MLIGDQLPALPNNDRIMVKPEPPRDRSEGGIIIPDKAQQRMNKGTLIHAGLAALDILYDHGHEIGDRIWWGQFAGCWEEWDHITKPGNNADCPHGDWRTLPCAVDRTMLRQCDLCGAERTQEPIYIMNAEDILGNETAEERRRAGQIGIARRYTDDKRTTHVIVRPGDVNMTTTLNGSTHGAVD